ncbi:hypothetical protein ASPZODRAFT_77400 [Penicilliopsis zonata CBS 506.65]|uniref:Major facilitator superfamily (MFS) profile domain-containing protein n=1 Tax=Penicilliopsis zonata CBS 506.65 TaxID=1073090 RepID=A0A1L9S517_9EURO|nr:hypothetical protein ASPZODRAFT_77400 [Penicilliopsis zonata CBS 506.65]OJJ42259.1 hypothetical protein ASPZODRAFT_77400 [Penicilliopsis zonata CBS 506.65]
MDIKPLSPVSSKKDGTHVSISEDDALQNVLVEYSAYSREQIAAIERRLKLKLDLRLFSCLIIMYILNYIDRNALPIAKLVGIESELGLSSTDYASCLSILYVGYLLMQIPSNLMLSRMRPSLYLPGAMIIWGCVSASTAATHNFAQLMGVRLVLGFFEAPFFAGAVFLCSSWYKASELSLRIAILFGGSMLSGSFGSLMALGITDTMAGVHGLSSWRWLFIIEGGMTIGFAILSMFILPNYPHNTRWLSKEEAVVAQVRLLDELGNEGDDSSFWQGMSLMLSDPKAWIMMTNHLLITITASFTNFFPTIMATLGFDTRITYALLSVPYLTGLCIVLLTCWYADRQRQRAYWIVGNLAVCMVGIAIVGGTLNIPARLIASILMVSGVTSASNINLAWIGTSIPSPKGKRAAAVAAVNMVGNLGNVIGSYLFPDNQAPRYPMALGVEGGGAILAIIGVLLYRLYLARQNQNSFAYVL